MRAFEACTPDRSGTYSYEQRDVAELGAEYESEFRAHRDAWDWFASQPPSYRKAATWWVVSAKKEQTQRRRLATRIDDSAHGRRIGPMRRPGGRER